jgi:phosphoesterase RecJ-like protein
MATVAKKVKTVRNMEIICRLISKAESFLIAGHINPDGDSIGSLLSLGLGLMSIGKKVHLISHDSIPEKYRLLPGIPLLVKSCSQPIDLAIAVDCGCKEMLGPVYKSMQNARAIMEIDHHQSRTSFANYSLIDPLASAAGELVYELLHHLNIPISADIAQNILTSIIIETNIFRVPDIRSQTFSTCATLLRTGVDFYKLTEKTYWNISRQTAILSGLCMSRCQFTAQGTLAYSILYQKDLRKHNAAESDADPIAEKLRQISGVKIGILFREKNNKHIRVCLRSRGGINVAFIAEHFGGGGHFSAAGCTIPNKKSAIKEFIHYTESTIEKHSELCNQQVLFFNKQHTSNQIDICHNDPDQPPSANTIKRRSDPQIPTEWLSDELSEQTVEYCDSLR